MLLLGFQGAGLGGFQGAGLGDFTSDYDDGRCARIAPSTDNTSFECIDSDGNVLSTKPINSSTAPNNATATGQSWYGNILTAITKGVAQGALTPSSALIPCVSPGVPANCNYTPAPVVEPWYMTPIGIGGIALAGLIGYFLIKK